MWDNEATKFCGPYRGVHYSIGQGIDGRWAWRLHPPIKGNSIRMEETVFGEVVGAQDDAIAAARAAIDAMGVTAHPTFS